MKNTAFYGVPLLKALISFTKKSTNHWPDYWQSTITHFLYFYIMKITLHKYKHLLFSIAFTFLFIQVKSQDTINQLDEKGRKQGYWIKFDSDKKKVYEGRFVNGVPTAKFTYYYDNGTPWSVSLFSQNGTITHTKMFDAGGKLMGEGKYVNQKKDSVWKYYNPEGKLISDENYILGVKNGMSHVYYASGGIVEEKQWKEGKLHGPCKKYFENGQIRYNGQYVNNNVDGYTKFYFSNGKIYAEGLYVNDLKEGDWKYYNKDGTADRIEKYIHGRLQGDDPNVITHEEQEAERKLYEEKQQQQKNNGGPADPFQE
jgi:antitoxin component YwqK of YwqJK toxin-antitoxin module